MPADDEGAKRVPATGSFPTHPERCEKGNLHTALALWSKLKALNHDQLLERGQLHLDRDEIVRIIWYTRRPVTEVRTRREHAWGNADILKRAKVLNEGGDNKYVTAHKAERSMVAIAKEVAALEAGDLEEGRGHGNNEAKAW